jgi:hypothetical protein
MDRGLAQPFAARLLKNDEPPSGRSKLQDLDGAVT